MKYFKSCGKKPHETHMTRLKEDILSDNWLFTSAFSDISLPSNSCCTYNSICWAS